jgi:hypothetical protein
MFYIPFDDTDDALERNIGSDVALYKRLKLYSDKSDWQAALLRTTRRR